MIIEELCGAVYCTDFHMRWSDEQSEAAALELVKKLLDE